MKIKQNIIDLYYDPRASCQVLGCLMLEPQRLSSREQQIADFDFNTPIHKTLFIAVHNLALQGLKSISLGDVETYLANNNPIGHKHMFEEWNGAEWITSILEDANPMNYDYYYWTVRKFSFMRIKMQNGQDVSSLLDMQEVEIEALRIQRENFDLLSIDDIVRYFDSVNLVAKRPFVTRSEESRRKAGTGAYELLERLSLAPSFGFTTESAYLNTIMRGLRRGAFMLETRDSGMGKTRVAIRRLLLVSAPYMWDFTKQSFVKNPHKPVASLYIGTEMELYEELEPMMWAFLSGVDEDKIHANTLTKEERIRVERAIEILQSTELYLEDEENYDISFISHTIEHYKTEYNIGAVAIDYLELTSALTSEFTQMTRGMGVREDQVLLNLSANIKNMAKRYDIGIIGFTQTTDEARRDGVRDQRAVKGARSLPNKCDLGMVTFSPTKKELELLEDIIERVGLNNNRCVPNICYSIYKNRGGKFKNIKIWGYQDLGTMEFIDLFCTDESYSLVNVDRTYLIPNLLDEEVVAEPTPVNYIVNDETGEIIEEDFDQEIELNDFIGIEEDEESADEFSEVCEEQLNYEEQVIEYNNSVRDMYQGVKGVEFTYDDNGLIEVHFTEEYEEMQAPDPEQVHMQSEILVQQEEVEENPFADLPIIGDEELNFLDEKPTFGKQRKGF